MLFQFQYRKKLTNGYIGLVRDPSLQANKEFYLLYSSEFQSYLKQARLRHNGRSG